MEWVHVMIDGSYWDVWLYFRIQIHLTFYLRDVPYVLGRCGELVQDVNKHWETLLSAQLMASNPINTIQKGTNARIVPPKSQHKY